MKQKGIYAIKNLINGKMYIGSSIDIETRWYSHKRLLNLNRHHSPSLQRAWKKHGEENFLHEIIEIVDDETKLLKREQYWIDTLGTFAKGYNVCQKAGNKLGVKHDELTKIMCGIVNIGRVCPDEHKIATSKRFKGKKQNPESVKKRSQQHIGMKRSEKTCRLIAEKATGRHHDEAVKMKMSEERTGSKNIRAILSEKDIPVIRKRLSNGESCRVVAEDYGVERSTINNIKRGKSWKHVV